MLIVFKQNKKYHFDNINNETQKEMSQQIIFAIRNILSTLFQSGRIRKFKQYELNARAKCFSLVLKIIEGNFYRKKLGLFHFRTLPKTKRFIYIIS